MAASEGMVGRSTGNRISIGLVILLAIAWMVPVITVLLMSIKGNRELMESTLSTWHPPYTIANYLNIIGTSNVFRWVLNSTIVSVSTTILTLIISSLAGYGFARTQFKGRNLLFILAMIGLAIPEQAVIIARHQMFTTLKIHNTYIALMLPWLADGFGVFLMTQYFRAIPKELDEAAMLDNASRFQIFFKVLLPLTVPAQATLAIFTFLRSWNDYLWPLISANKPAMFTLTVGIASTQTNFAQSEGLGYLMAQAVFASLPTLIVYLIFQKYLIRAVAGAAVR